MILRSLIKFIMKLSVSMNNPNLVTKLTHTVKSFECGPKSELRINNLLLLFQEAAYISAENLGFGYHSLQEKNMTWVLASVKIHSIKFPKWTEPINISTWPSGHNRLLGFREFLVTDKNDEHLISATSEWLAIDLNSRKPININDFKIELPDYGVKALDERLNRLNPKRFGEGKEIFEVNVPYSSIDENGHVNNAEYVKWSFDGLRQANLEIEGISTLQISFISEVFEKETCKIFFKEDEDGSKLLWGVNTKNNDYVFAIKLG